MAMDMLVGAPIKELQEIGRKAEEEFEGPKGYEVGYELFGINGKMLGHGEPIRVKHGERVLFHVLNASAGRFAASLCPAMPSGSSRSMAILCRRKPTCRCYGLGPPSASPLSSK